MIDNKFFKILIENTILKITSKNNNLVKDLDHLKEDHLQKIKTFFA